MLCGFTVILSGLMFIVLVLGPVIKYLYTSFMMR